MENSWIVDTIKALNNGEIKVTDLDSQTMMDVIDKIINE